MTRSATEGDGDRGSEDARRRASRAWRVVRSAALLSAIFALAQPARAGLAVWTSNGPDGVAVTTLVVDPTSEGVIYAGSAIGLFASADGSDSWQLRSGDYAVTALAIAPLTPSGLYVGWYTTCPFGGCRCARGLFKRTEGGETAVIGFGCGWVDAVAIDPSAPTTLHVGTHFCCPAESSVRTSTDAGDTWSSAVVDPNHDGVRALVIDPLTTTTLYAATPGGLFTSADGGASWAAIDNGPTDAAITALAVAPSVPPALYVGTENGLFRSRNGGASWSASGTGVDAVNALAIDPMTATNLYAGTDSGVFRSTDAGDTWSALNTGLANRQVFALAIDPGNPRRLYAGTDDGVFAIEQSDANTCPGDCSDDREVTIDELILSLDVALERTDITDCAAGDRDRDGAITVDEIIRAVKAALEGCDADIEEATIAALQAAIDGGGLSALDLSERYLARIRTLDQKGPTWKAVVETNPDARSIAAGLDAERGARGVRGPLHGIPVLLKDNIDTGDSMLTTAGSLALLDAPASQDATVAARLRAAGAVLLGKTNLSEWANMRSLKATSGWSARGGQTRNPYAADRSPCGSSSGSAVAVSANLCAVALGTETDGSIVCPAAANGIVGLKPTVGLTSRAGVVPLAHTQDTVGILARTVADAATVLGVLAGPDPRDPATAASAGHAYADYTPFLDPDGLRGARIGIPRQVFFGGNAESDAIAEAAITALRAAGATIVDPADVPTAATLAIDPTEFRVLLYEFKADLNSYLATRSGIAVTTLADLIAFNLAHADTEMPLFGQEIFLLANPLGSLDTPAYLAALATSLRLSREEGIDAVMDEYQLDALFAPTGPPPWVIDYATGDPAIPFPLHSVAARAGYPVITVPAGFAGGLPVGVSFVGRAFSEPTLIRLAHAFEQATHARRPPLRNMQ